ncbi:MAG: tetratricopeptide repeat protein [Candidatus Obscuribacterales bacterium]|nr:tetratricopeptide repeat protein [Candidatus Obscuribacterales bacterium]
MNWQEYKKEIKESIGQGDFDKSEQLLLGAIELLKGSNDSDERVCVCLDQLAWIYIGQKKLSHALTHYLESLRIKTAALGPDNPIVARAYKKLATVSYMMENFSEAEKYGKEALHIFRNSLGADAEETRQTLADVVALLRKLDRNVEANILAGNKMVAPANEQAQASQTFLKINICKECDMPYDGEGCPRCQGFGQ